MKALTIKQPWAEMIAGRYKRVENRSWKTNYRGPIAIHAGVNKQTVRAMEIDIHAMDLPTLVFGAVIATADIVDCVYILKSSPKFRADALKKYPWLKDDIYATGPWCWILKNVKRLKKSVPAKGKLSFWEWTP